MVITALAAVALAFGRPAWRLLRPQSPTAAGSYAGYNVLLVTIDTLRADHLPIHGYAKVSTPGLDALASESLVFKNAIAHVPLTMPSHTSMLTGLLPPTHGVPENGSYILDPKVTTLQGILAANGYATAAFISSFALDGRWGLAKDFATYFDNFSIPDFHEGNQWQTQRRGAETEAEAARWLTAHKDGRFFAWVHLYDPHQPYDPPEPFRSRYPSNQYDAEIAYTDEIVGRLLARLKELGVFERTLVVLTSDHGEGLGEHGEKTHGVFVYAQTLHVPLLIRLPAGKQQKIEPLVRHIDLAPTLLDWLGLRSPTPMQGQTLIPLIQGKEETPRLAYSESQYSSLHYGWSPLFSLTTERFKLIKAPRPELYDRLGDPGEQRNLYAERPALARALEEDLDGIVRGAVEGAPVQRVTMDADTEERLRALGYIGTTIGDTEAFRSIDPKDKIALHDALSDASMNLLENKNAEALRAIEPAIAQDPEMVEAHYVAGVAALRIGQSERAIAEFQQVLAYRPDNTRALYNLGTVYQTLGRRPEAEASFLKVLAADPKHMPSVVHLANLYRQAGEVDKAKRRFAEAADLYEATLRTVTVAARRSDLLARLAEVSFKAGRVEGALDRLKEAIALAPEKPTLNYNLALVSEEKGDLAGAVAAYRREATIAPHNYRALRGLGVALRQEGHFDEAVSTLERALEVQPQDPETYYRLAETYYLANRNLAEARRFARQAVSLAPTFGQARQLLTSIERKLGRG